MVDTSQKIAQIMTMIRKKQYFVINRPRQYGKTTTLTLLELELLKSEEYLPVFISFESVDNTSYKDPKAFCAMFLKMLSKNQNIKNKDYSKYFIDSIDKVNNFDTLSDALTEILNIIEEKIVLMIDEVDKSSDNQIFLYFLGMLRDKYLKTQRRQDITFHSVILVGLHDVKSLKMRIYEEYPSVYPYSGSHIDSQEKTIIYNSPWNIATDFKVDMSFSTVEIGSMLQDYAATTGNSMDTQSISEKLYFWTSGYPFLVSKLCKIVDEEILINRENKKWEIIDIDKSVSILLKENNTLFESLSKNLQNNLELSSLIESVIFKNADVPFDLLDPIINFAFMYGMIKKNEKDNIKIHNKIFEETMTNYFVSINSRKNKSIFGKIHEPYIKSDGRLDMAMVLRKFQETVKEKYSSRDFFKSTEFLEDEVRMMFFMFLKPIINGYGFSFKEVQTGPEKRMDVVVIFRDEKFVIELKIWRGEEYHKSGIDQLHGYMKSESINTGYMLIADKTRNKQFEEWEEEGILCVVI